MIDSIIPYGFKRKCAFREVYCLVNSVDSAEKFREKENQKNPCCFFKNYYLIEGLF